MPKKEPPKTEEAPSPPLVVVESARFAKDLQRLKKRGKDMSRFKAVIIALANRRPLDARYGDPALRWNWNGYHNCDIDPDWVLVYQTTASELRLVRNGTHSDLRL